MSDKPLPITIQGSYEGYAVSISLETSLDKLPALVKRMRANGIEPLPASAATAPGKPAPDTLEGEYTAHAFREPRAKGPVCRVAVKTSDGRERWADFWRDEPTDLLGLPEGTRLRFYGREKPSADGRYLNFSVSRWERV